MTSATARRLTAGAPAIAEAHFRAEADPYDPERNPDGYLNLGTAENRLVWDLLAPRLAACPPLTGDAARYGPLYGTPEFRRRVAAFLGPHVDPGDLVVVSGATAALDVVATALCDPGEVIVTPAPYYGAFDVDLAGRSGARLRPAAGGAFEIDPAAVACAITEARRDGLVVRAIAISSPHNPLGVVHPRQLLRELAQVAAELDVDVISDEIYANCVFGRTPFTPMAGLPGSPLPAHRVHTVWGFAKDFGLPGFKAGVLHTTDPAVRAAARELAYFAPLSTQTQSTLGELLGDAAWIAAFLAESADRLGRSYAAAAALLDAHAIEYVPAEAGFSIFARLSDAECPDEELRLWRELLERLRVSILPGRLFHCPRPGWFRVCHSVPAATVRTALTRVGAHLARAAR
ncbi:aminotransferase class I/II-fold pyridoxal phosphate-dependent enzyme [Streptosporangiaceae bacterium NEAU-GS5]|nr:aminotransferase class I/II-fold pyridoxal phosphate-dependent enzyme [Streptosporangiaceae bacterium NEAU-GS5]